MTKLASDGLIEAIKYSGETSMTEPASDEQVSTLEALDEYQQDGLRGEEIRALIARIRQQEAEIERMRAALKPFAAYGSLIAECGNEGVQITTLVYSEKRVSEYGEVVREGQPIAADDWLFGICIADRAVPAAMVAPVMTASYFYDARAALKGGEA